MVVDGRSGQNKLFAPRNRNTRYCTTHYQHHFEDVHSKEAGVLTFKGVHLIKNWLYSTPRTVYIERLVNKCNDYDIFLSFFV